ncbi:MAG: chromate transporter, partial [Deltaproteobacteria bacterium]
LSQHEFLDALAFAQVTPGPITTMSAFVGYKVAGGLGALAASFGMYLPGAIMILGILPRVRKKLEARQELQHFQIGAVPTVIGCLVTASFGLLISGLTDPARIGLFIFLLGIQIRMQWPPWLVILLGSGFQAILQFFFF